MVDNQWKDLANCRRFFATYAQKKGFDPLNAANWYDVSSSDIRNEKVCY